MFERSKKAALQFKRLIAVAAVPALSVLALSLTPHPSDTDASALYLEDAYVQQDAAAAEVYVTDASGQLLSVSSAGDLLLSAGKAVTVYPQGAPVSAISRQETVEALLRRLDVRPSPLEMVSAVITEDAVEISVGSEMVFYERMSTVTEHETVYQYNDSKPVWQETVLQEGRDGEYGETYEVVYHSGQAIGRQLIDVVDTQPVPTIIEKGTMENFANNGDAVSAISTSADGSGTITLVNGEVLTFSEARTMRGTAYTTGGGVGSITASGTTVHVGVVAVDRDVVPLGTKVYVVSNDGAYVYGFAVAEDTGVRGNSIDLYMDTSSECIQFGVRNCTVYILD